MKVCEKNGRTLSFEGKYRTLLFEMWKILCISNMQYLSLKEGSRCENIYIFAKFQIHENSKTPHDLEVDLLLSENSKEKIKRL